MVSIQLKLATTFFSHGKRLRDLALLSTPGTPPFGKKLWTLDTVPRHKMLLWRILQEAIPVRSKLNHRGVQCDIICPRCLEREETSDHTFMHCHHAAKI
jgi:hypothetical protein